MPRHRAARFALAISVAALLVLSAPFVGQIRSEIRRAFPGQFVAIVGGLIAAGLLAAMAVAVTRISTQRVRRYGLIVLATAIAAGYAAINAGDNPDSNVVELFHFLQYGLIAFLFYRAWQPASDVSLVALPLMSGLIVGTVEEWFQWFIPNRVGELKDVMLNLTALCTGLLFAIALEPPHRWRLSLASDSRARVLRMAAATVVALAAFLTAVHLGSAIDDDEIGTFESRWPAAALLDLQASRRAQWAANPPPVKLVRLSREDQYLTEGIQHVRERNRSWDEGRVADAWLENRILEKYYEPVLDTPTHEGAGHRWPPEQRADAEARFAQAGPHGPYVSHAYPYPIYRWSPLALWTVVAAASVALLLASSSKTG